jgi:hypothetical protein
MYQVLRMLHVLGWSGWFGLAVAEPIVGALVRKADPQGRAGLANAWLRIGRVQLVFMAIATAFGLATFFVLGNIGSVGMGGFMKQPGNLYLHIMLGLGLLAAVLTLVAGQSRGAAGQAVTAGDEAAFSKAYKRAAMMSGMSSLLIVATILEVLLRGMGA